MTKPIFLLTDFGVGDAYVGQVRAVLARLAPESQIHDISHGVAPFAVDHGAWLLEVTRPHLPTGSVVLGVVDPGVGGSREGVAVADSHGRYFVGPDNGLFSCVLGDEHRGGDPAILSATSASARAFTASALGINPELVSPTFHGRDLFAPAAAQLAAGRPFDSLGGAIGLLRCLAPFRAEPAGAATLSGRVVHVDRFGNLITTVRASQLHGRSVARIELGGAAIEASFRTFEDAADGTLFWHRDSSGFIAVAVAGGSAFATLGIDRGATVQVVFA